MEKTYVEIIDRAKKLKELADRGIDGEMENAKRMYLSYKERHGLTDAQVTGHVFSAAFTQRYAGTTDKEFINSLMNTLNDPKVQEAIMQLATNLARIFDKRR